MLNSMPLRQIQSLASNSGTEYLLGSRERGRRTTLKALALLALSSGAPARGADGVFNRIWGAGAAGLIDGKSDLSRFNNPANVAVAPNGTVYVADFDNGKVRVIATDGMVSTLNSPANFTRPFGLAVSADGQTLYVQTDRNDNNESGAQFGTVWRFNTSSLAVPTVVARNVGRVRGLTAMADGRLAMSDLSQHVVSILEPRTGTLTVLAGALSTPGFADGTGAAALFNRPYGLASMSDGSLLVADQSNNRIRRITLAGVVTTFAGTATAGAANGAIASGTFNRPQGVAVAGSTVFVGDTGNFLVRRISGGTVSTEAGSVGVRGFADATGTEAQFYGLEGIAINAEGTALWIADGNGGEGTNFNRVRRLSVSIGINADADKVFNWVEKTYASIFSPGAQTATLPGYRYRTYSGGHYLAVNESGTARLYYLGPLSSGQVADLGLLSAFSAMAN